MAAHRKSDSRRNDLCGGGLRKRALLDSQGWLHVVLNLNYHYFDGALARIHIAVQSVRRILG